MLPLKIKDSAVVHTTRSFLIDCTYSCRIDIIEGRIHVNKMSFQPVLDVFQLPVPIKSVTAEITVAAPFCSLTPGSTTMP